MERYLIVLANSRKYSGRCVAGVELLPIQKRGQRYEIKSTHGRPAWIRPIQGTKFGQVDEHLVEDINLLDVIKIEDLTYSQEGYQSENVLFKPETIEILESVPPMARFLDKLTSPVEFSLFGNDSSTVSPEEIQQLDYSLVLIRPESWSCHHFTNIFGKKPE